MSEVKRLSNELFIGGKVSGRGQALRLANQEEDEDRKQRRRMRIGEGQSGVFKRGFAVPGSFLPRLRLNLRSDLSISRGKKPPRDLDLSETLSLLA